jgi:endonuclease-3
VSIGHTIRRLRREAPRWRATAMAELAARRPDPFRVLVACLLSLRTKDDTTGPAAARLFALADTPEAMRRLSPRTIERAIYPVGFYRTKARALREISRDLLTRFGGTVPDDIDALLTLKGVGRKTANLVVTQGFNKPGICVDVHVHRISNRWGYVTTRSPEETEMALRRVLPRRYWIGYNDLLVSFGQNVCLPVSPRCSVCPIRPGCPRRGVTRSR